MKWGPQEPPSPQLYARGSVTVPPPHKDACGTTSKMCMEVCCTVSMLCREGSTERLCFLRWEGPKELGSVEQGAGVHRGEHWPTGAPGPVLSASWHRPGSP